MGKRITVYFDTNVWRELSKEENYSLCDELRYFKRNHKVRILPSVLIFFEICGLILNKEKLDELIRTVEIILDLAHDKPIIEPYDLISIDYSLSPNKRKLRPKFENPAKYNSSMKKVLRAASQESNHANEINYIRKYYHGELNKREIFKKSADDFIKLLRSAFNSKALKKLSITPEQFVSDIEKRHWLQNCVKMWMNELGIKKRRSSSKPILYYGLAGRLWKAWAHVLYCQFIRGRSPRRSDYDDLFHIILGGVSGNFVSGDERARECFNFTWQDKRKIRSFDLPEFLFILRARGGKS